MYIVKILDSIIKELKDNNVVFGEKEVINRKDLVEFIKELPYILWINDFQQLFAANINSKAKQYYGYSDSDLKTLGFDLYKDLIHPDHFKDVHTTMSFFTEDPKGVFVCPYRIKGSDNSWKWTYTAAKALNFNENGEPNLILSLVFDIDSMIDEAFVNKNQPISVQFVEDNNDAYQSLTEREVEILRFIGMGLSSKEIAEKANISDKTVETHRVNIRLKLKAKNTAELVKFAILFHPEII